MIHERKFENLLEISMNSTKNRTIDPGKYRERNLKRSVSRSMVHGYAQNIIAQAIEQLRFATSTTQPTDPLY